MYRTVGYVCIVCTFGDEYSNMARVLYSVFKRRTLSTSSAASDHVIKVVWPRTIKLGNGYIFIQNYIDIYSNWW